MGYCIKLDVKKVIAHHEKQEKDAQSGLAMIQVCVVQSLPNCTTLNCIASAKLYGDSSSKYGCSLAEGLKTASDNVWRKVAV